MFDLTIFGLGCVGAAAPEFVRLYKSRSKPVAFPPSYYLISILFFFLGGLVAVILPTSTPWGAFYAGISLPSIISGVASSILPKTEEVKEPPKPMMIQAGLAKGSVREYLALLWR